MARTTRTPGAAEPVQTDEAQPEAIAIEQFDAVAEENIKLKEEIAALKKQLRQKDAPAASTNPDIKPAANKRLVLTDKGWTAEE